MLPETIRLLVQFDFTTHNCLVFTFLLKFFDFIRETRHICCTGSFICTSVSLENSHKFSKLWSHLCSICSKKTCQITSVCMSLSKTHQRCILFLENYTMRELTMISCSVASVTITSMFSVVSCLMNKRRT